MYCALFLFPVSLIHQFAPPEHPTLLFASSHPLLICQLSGLHLRSGVRTSLREVTTSTDTCLCPLVAYRPHEGDAQPALICAMGIHLLPSPLPPKHPRSSSYPPLPFPPFPPSTRHARTPTFPFTHRIHALYQGYPIAFSNYPTFYLPPS